MSGNMKSYALPVIGFMFLTLLRLSLGQGIAPSPAAEVPSSDGTAIDQGIAYFLLMVALAVTYLLH